MKFSGLKKSFWVFINFSRFMNVSTISEFWVSIFLVISSKGKIEISSGLSKEFLEIFV